MKLIYKTLEFMAFLAIELYAFGFLFFEMDYILIPDGFLGQYYRYILLLIIIICISYTIDGYFTQKL